MTFNGELPDEEEDDEIPEDLRDRWARRDLQYQRDRHPGSKRGPLTGSEIGAIRSLREGEAEEIHDRVLMREARTWIP
jgi:hypothetical protein